MPPATEEETTTKDAIDQTEAEEETAMKEAINQTERDCDEQEIMDAMPLDDEFYSAE